LGRFSVEYRKAFGETPSQTLHGSTLVNRTVQDSFTFAF